MTQKNKNLLKLCILLIVIFISVYILNINSVFTSDDFSFLYDYRGTDYTDGIKRITSVSQIFVSMKNLYLHVNGRIVYHFILQFLLMFPKIVFNIINSFVYVLIGIIIYRLSTKEKMNIKNIKIHILILIYSLMFIFLPSFGMTVLWCSGSLNYLWGTLFILLYFFYFLELINNKKISILNFITIIFLSIMASNTVENFAIAVLFFTIYEIIISSIKNKKIKIWPFFCLLFNIFNIYILFSAVKISSVRKISFLLDFSFIFSKLIKLIKSFGSWNFIFIISILPILYFFIVKPKKSDLIFSNMAIYYYTALVSLLALVFAPYYADRTCFLACVLFLICIINIIYNFKSYIFTYIAISIITIVSIYYYVFVAYKDVKKSYNEYIKIEEIIKTNKEQGIKNIFVPSYYSTYSKYTAFNNPYAFLTFSQKSWINEWMAHYYGVDSIFALNHIEY